jgi:acyl carrier protein phosphodiesterase
VNYLAHFHLAYGDNDLTVGALLGDFVKGPLKGAHGRPVENGITLHRKIDAFTDQHQLLKHRHREFEPVFRRYSGIMTDVVFDHFLSKHWEKFHPQPLTDFSEEVFELLRNNPILPPGAQKMADILDSNKLFAQYQNWDTVDSALTHIGKRLKGINPLNTAATELHRHYNELEGTFFEFYQQLQNYVVRQREIIATEKY